MGFIKHNQRQIIIAIVVVVLLYAGYSWWSGSNSSSGDALTSSTPPASGVDLLAALSNLQTVKLDGTIFSDPLFLSLSDYGTTIPPQPLGNQNPFAPLSGGGSGSASVPTIITTGTASKH